MTSDVVDVSRTKRHRSRESVNGNLCRRSFRGALAGGRGRYRRGTKVARKRGMFTRHRVVIAAVSASMMIAAATPLRAATIRVYQIEDLGFFPGSNYIAGSALNARGDIAGSFFAADGYMHAFRWTSSNGLEDLGTNGGFSSMAWAMNDNGDVAGVYWDRGWTSHPFVASPGHPMVDLSLRYPDIEWVYAISNDGRLTGFTWGFHAFRTQPDGTFQELTTNYSFGAGINDSGDVTGVVWRDEGPAEPRHAFRYSDAGGFVDLGTVAGGWSGGRAINRSGVVVGFSGATETAPTRPFRAQPGLPIEDLGALPWGFLGAAAGGDAYALNDRGDVVGIADGWMSWTPFLYTDATGMIDLKFRITMAEQALYPMEDASGINNAAQIMVHYGTFDGTSFGLGTARLTPYEREFAGPVARPTVDTAVLTPPDNRMVTVSVDPHVTDEYDPEPLCRISRVINSERPATGPDPDVLIDYGLSVQLRAARLGSGSGRTYTIVLSCSDRLDVTSETTIVVAVPHDNR
jgi:probable HAF family extracellular repeat protein